MAFCTIDFEYGDHSMLEGFRLYRDSIFRQSCLPHERQFKDSVDDYPNRMAKYDVRAFDDLDRESFGCKYAEVKLSTIVTPPMTDNNLPSGDVSCKREPADLIYKYTPEAWKYFDRVLNAPNYTNIRINNTDDIYVPIKFTHTYKFSEETRITTWGWQQYYFTTHTPGLYLKNCKIKIYGSNDSELGLLLDSQPFDNSISNRQHLFDIEPASFKNYNIILETEVISDDIGVSFVSQFYLMDRLENA